MQLSTHTASGCDHFGVNNLASVSLKKTQHISSCTYSQRLSLLKYDMCIVAILQGIQKFGINIYSIIRLTSHL